MLTECEWVYLSSDLLWNLNDETKLFLGFSATSVSGR